MEKNNKQPCWCCDTCGTKFGFWYYTGTYTGPTIHCPTYHIGTCQVCQQNDIAVTEARDFGYLKEEWQDNLSHTRKRTRAFCDHAS